MLTPEVKKQLIDEALELIEGTGGVGAMLDDLEASRKLRVHVDKQHTRLLEQYPNKWVAMGWDGEIAIRGARDELLAAIESAGIDPADVVIQFMDTDPPVLIL